jgi:nitrite reductase (NO-forming)
MKILRIVLLAAFMLLFISACSPQVSTGVNTEYVLTTAMRDGKFVYLGVDGDINGLVNPALHAKIGEQITVMLVNSGEGEHDINFSSLNVHSDVISKKGETTSVTFTVPTEMGVVDYFDSTHAKVGMKGVLLVGDVIAPESPVSEAAVADAMTMPMEDVKVEYTLETTMADGKMVFLGKGGEIDGKTNPDLKANVGDTISLTLISGDGVAHNFYLDELNVKSADVSEQGSSITMEFAVDKEGTFAYYCNIPGHRQIGMEGKLIAGSGVNSAGGANQQASSNGGAQSPAVAPAGVVDASAVDITRDPTDLPAPLPQRGPEKVVLNLETVEISGKLADGTSYKYWTFDGKIPGPFLRVRVGDTVEVHLKNLPDSLMAHSIDLHAVTGPGGGAVATQTKPGGETMFTFKALNVGLYVYHCATPMVAQHISNGMYGMILVEPVGGLPKVDHEFYMMQGELYTTQPFGTTGDLAADTTKLLDEQPEYFVFNGASMALASEAHMLHAKTGETVRIFFGVGGPNFTSSFHVIGEIFDRVFDQASLTSKPLTDVQTTMVPPGGATMVEFKVEVPGRYILVDHALSRLQRGLAGFLMVDGEANPNVFDGTITAGSGH